jgi:hemolysin activation/secretion protein
LGLFDATRAGDPFASRRDGSARATLVEFWSEWNRPLSKRVTLVAAAAGQFASRPLLATQEIGIGGARFARGFDFNERSGDNGLMGSLELRYSIKQAPMKALSNMVLYGFVDGGDVWNLRGGRGGGRSPRGGAGLRTRVADKLDIGLEAALPFNADRFGSRDRSPRLSFSIGVVL